MSENTCDRTLVVGVDGSDVSLNAARWAGAVATKQQVPLTLAYAVSTPPYYLTEAGILVLDEFIEQMRDSAEEILEQTAKLIRHQYPDIRIEHQVLTGPADVALVEFSDKARLIVVGANNAGPLGARLLGSTATYVANNATCPVVAWRGELGRPLPLDLPVVVGVDGSELSGSAVAHAFEFASLFGVNVVAVHAWNNHALRHGHTDQAERAVLSESVAGMREAYPDVVLVQVCEQTNPTAALLNQASSAQLLVVGSHGHNTIGAALLGSTSNNLIRHAPCPTMICR